MKVYILSEIRPYENDEILRVYSTPEAAIAYGKGREPNARWTKYTDIDVVYWATGPILDGGVIMPYLQIDEYDVIEPEGPTVTQSQAEPGTVAYLGHPANEILVVKAPQGFWRYVHSGEVVDEEQFRGGWHPLPASRTSRDTHA